MLHLNKESVRTFSSDAQPLVWIPKMSQSLSHRLRALYGDFPGAPRGQIVDAGKKATCRAWEYVVPRVCMWISHVSLIAPDKVQSILELLDDKLHVHREWSKAATLIIRLPGHRSGAEGAWDEGIRVVTGVGTRGVSMRGISG